MYVVVPIFLSRCLGPCCPITIHRGKFCEFCYSINNKIQQILSVFTCSVREDNREGIQSVHRPSRKHAGKVG